MRHGFGFAALVALLCASDARADCLSRSTAAALDARLQAAEAAYTDFDADGFGAATSEATLLLPCLGEPLSSGLAAHYHRVEGLRLYSAGDETASLQALRTARVLDPGYRFPTTLVPAEDTLRKSYDAIDLSQTRDTRVPAARHGQLLFDGADSQNRPVDRATIMQALDADGVVTTTAYLYPGAAVPPYDAVPRNRYRLVGASGASLAVSGLVYGLALASRSELAHTQWTPDPNPATPENEAAAQNDALWRHLASRTNTLVYTSLGLVAVSAGLGGIALTVHK